MEQEQEIMQENNEVETATTQEEENAETETQVEAKTFTQEQVNEMVRERLERDRKSTFTRYGVNTRDELDTLVGKSQAYDVINERYEALQEKYRTLNEDFAFTKNNVNPDRYDDVKIYFKGKELELNNDNLLSEIATHPEWLNSVKRDDKPITTIEKISPDREAKHIESEKEKASKLFGLNL